MQRFSLHRAEDGSPGTKTIATIGDWIRGADNKAAILGGFAVAVAAGLFTDSDQIAKTLRTGGTHGWLARIAFAGATALLLGSVTLLLSMLWPRTPEPDSPNRYAFPSLALPRIGGGTVNAQTSAVEAEVEAQILAIIATTKFRLVKLATVALAGSFLLLTAWRVIVSTVG